jgi:hypothetical protein
MIIRLTDCSSLAGSDIGAWRNDSNLVASHSHICDTWDGNINLQRHSA